MPPIQTETFQSEGKRKRGLPSRGGGGFLGLHQRPMIDSMFICLFCSLVMSVVYNTSNFQPIVSVTSDHSLRCHPDGLLFCVQMAIMIFKPRLVFAADTATLRFLFFAYALRLSFFCVCVFFFIISIQGQQSTSFCSLFTLE